MIYATLKNDLQVAVSELGFEGRDAVLYLSENSAFGDYSSNAALQLAKVESENGKQSSQDIAKQISEKLTTKDYISKIDIAGPGFLNFFIHGTFLTENALQRKDYITQSAESKKFLVEYGHVNLLKEVHIGHLRTFILGESVARLLESKGHQVFRANYQGDIGLHIAKAIWGIRQSGWPQGSLTDIQKADFLGSVYAKGNTAYESDESAKQEIDALNITLYQLDSGLQADYHQARKWSIDYLEPIYELLGVSYDQCFFESEVFERGKKVVTEHLGSVFEQSNGAIVFPGEKYGLHTRVFISSAGNPTYEAKDIGLAEAEYQAFPYDLSIHVVANEQEEYFKVIFQAIEQIFPNLKNKKYHLSYGFVDLKQGKMSSRTGNVVSFHDLYDSVLAKVKELVSSSKEPLSEEDIKIITIGAIKFSYLKHSSRPNMLFDLEQSVSLDGASGPYIQYSYVRTQSILENTSAKKSPEGSVIELTPEERRLVLLLDSFDLTVENALEGYRVNMIAEYLIQLAGSFNLFYQKHRVLDSDQQQFRLELTQRVGETLKQGLSLLGIAVPSRM